MEAPPFPEGLLCARISTATLPLFRMSRLGPLAFSARKHDCISYSQRHPVDEIVRMVDALQFHEEHGEVGMKETAESVANYLIEHSKQL
jgi:hypothetical protein